MRYFRAADFRKVCDTVCRMSYVPGTWEHGRLQLDDGTLTVH